MALARRLRRPVLDGQRAAVRASAACADQDRPHVVGADCRGGDAGHQPGSDRFLGFLRAPAPPFGWRSARQETFPGSEHRWWRWLVCLLRWPVRCRSGPGENLPGSFRSAHSRARSNGLTASASSKVRALRPSAVAGWPSLILIVIGQGLHCRGPAPVTCTGVGPLTAVSQTGGTAPDPGVLVGHPVDPDVRK